MVPRRSDERGAAAIFLALSITVIMVAAAFVVDLGWWYLRAQQAQRAADAAALAGVVWMPGDFSKATAAARETAKANGFEHGVNGISVQVSTGANDRQLSVRIVDGNVARFFSSVVQSGPMTVGRRAVAQYELPVPLGSAENQLGGSLDSAPTVAHRGVYAAVNGLCTRRADGDHISAGYYTLNQLTNPNISCQLPYATYTPAPPPAAVQKNPTYRAAGYTYVVDIPPATTVGCSIIPQPAGCTATANKVTFEVQDPLTNKGTATNPDQLFNAPASSGCGTGPSTIYNVGTIFSIYGADDSPLDVSDNPHIDTLPTFGSEMITSTSWQPLAVIPASSRSGRYLVKVKSQADLACSAWSNAFGLRARVGDAAFSLCSTQPTSPAYSASCPQVHGLDAMSLRAYPSTVGLPCASPIAAGNKCATFYLARVDPAYAGRQMVITLFDPDEGAQRLRILQPNGQRIGFSWETVDVTPSSPTYAKATVDATSAGLNTSGTTFNDRRLHLVVDLPDAAALAVDDGWFKIEYEVSGTGVVNDRTTWGVGVRGTPVHLVT